MSKEVLMKSRDLEIFTRATVPVLFHAIVRIEPHLVAAAYREPGKEEFKELTYQDLARKVKALAQGLIYLGLKKGEMVSILSDTRYEWPVADFAILTSAGVTVTVYPTLSTPSVEYIIRDSGSKIIFVENQEQLDKVLEIKEDLPHLEYIITIEKTEKPLQNIYTMEEVQEMGKVYDNNIETYEQIQQSISPDDLCSIVYSSGTTGKPKGVMLTHWNFVSNLFSMREIIAYEPGDNFLGFLPFAHVYMRIVFLAAVAGRQACYFSRPDKMAHDMPAVRPNAMTAVPRLWERVYDRIMETVESSRITRRIIFYKAAKIAREMGYFRSKSIEPSRGLKFKHSLAERLVFKRIRAAAGLDRLKICVSAGSALPKDLAYFYYGIGIPLLEGYGLTETAGPSNVNPSENFRPASIGPPLPGVVEKIAEDGEILVKGDNVMKGYYNLPEETKEAFTEDGWLKTGDIGYFDDEGYLYFKERKKHLVVLSTGKNVAPLPIEDKLKESSWIEEAVVLGDNRKFVSALIQPNHKKILDFARQNNIKFDEGLIKYGKDQAGEDIPIKIDRSLLNNKKIIDLIQEAVDDANKYFDDFEQVKKFHLLDEAITQDKGELTPTLKVKRNVIEDKYAEQIEGLYH